MIWRCLDLGSHREGSPGHSVEFYRWKSKLFRRLSPSFPSPLTLSFILLSPGPSFRVGAEIQSSALPFGEWARWAGEDAQVNSKSSQDMVPESTVQSQENPTVAALLCYCRPCIWSTFKFKCESDWKDSIQQGTPSSGSSGTISSLTTNALQPHPRWRWEWWRIQKEWFTKYPASTSTSSSSITSTGGNYQSNHQFNPFLQQFLLSTAYFPKYLFLHCLNFKMN